jgi:hypothetical protein
MGNGDIVVGRMSPAPRYPPARPEREAESASATAPIQAVRTGEESHCGAMSQQRGNSGTVSTPQKFVRLVGCRDPEARPARDR